MNKKDKKQKQVGVINHISQPLNFRHNFHLGLDGVRGDHNDVHMQELQAAFESVTSSNNVTPSPRHPFENLNAEYSRNDPVMDGRNEAAMYQQGVELRAPRPCRSRDISEENSLSDDHELAYKLKGYLVPAIRFEVDELLEKKLLQILPELLTYGASGVHCCTCRCLPSSRESITSTLFRQTWEARRPQECAQSKEARHHSRNVSSASKAHKSPTHRNNSPYANTEITPGLHSENHYGQLPDSQRKPTPSDSQIARQMSDTSVKSFRNPTYPIAFDSYIINRTSDTGSSSSSKGEERHSREHQTLGRSSSARQSNEIYDERECLAKALQMNVADLLASMCDKHGEFIEAIHNEGLILREEHDACLNIPDGKGRMRYVLTLVKGRDAGVIKDFYAEIRKHNVKLYSQLMESFTRNASAGVVNVNCAFCRLVSQVSVRYVVDSLWASDILDDGLYTVASTTDTPIGAQDFIWRRIIQNIDMCYQKDPESTITAVKAALVRHKHYSHLAELIEEAFDANGCLKCHCGETDRKSVESPASPRPPSTSKCFDEIQLRQKINECFNDQTDTSSQVSQSRSFEEGYKTQPDMLTPPDQGRQPFHQRQNMFNSTPNMTDDSVLPLSHSEPDKAPRLDPSRDDWPVPRLTGVDANRSGYISVVHPGHEPTRPPDNPERTPQPDDVTSNVSKMNNNPTSTGAKVTKKTKGGKDHEKNDLVASYV